MIKYILIFTKFVREIVIELPYFIEETNLFNSYLIEK